MRLIDSEFDMSARYADRHNDASRLPKVWRHDQVNQLLTRERFGERIYIPPDTVGEVEGFYAAH